MDVGCAELNGEMGVIGKGISAAEEIELQCNAGSSMIKTGIKHPSPSIPFSWCRWSLSSHEARDGRWFRQDGRRGRGRRDALIFRGHSESLVPDLDGHATRDGRLGGMFGALGEDTALFDIYGVVA